MSRSVLMDTLQGIRFLNGVKPSHLEELLPLARVEEFAEGEVLFEEGQDVEGVYLIIQGEVALEVSALGLSPQLVLCVGPGDSLGWSALLERRHRTATARVTMPTMLIRFDGGELLDLCQKNHSFGFEIMRKTAASLATRLHAMRQRFLEVYRLQPESFSSRAEECGID